MATAPREKGTRLTQNTLTRADVYRQCYVYILGSGFCPLHLDLDLFK